MSENFEITRYNPYIFDDPSKALKIVEGEAYVFVIAERFGSEQSKVFFKHLNIGDIVPGFYYEIDGYKCRFLIVPAYENQLSNQEEYKLKVDVIDCREEYRNDFISDFDKLTKKGNFEEEVTQFYLISLIKDTRNIYADYISNKKAEEASADKIYKLFKHRNFLKSGFDVNSNTEIFPFTKVAKFLNIECLDYDKLSVKEKKDLTPEKYADLSGFVCRSVQLEPGWQNQNAGPFVCCRKDNNEYIACIPSGRKYIIYSSKDTEGKVLDKKDLDNILPKAYMFYKPLPKKSLSYKDIYKFILSQFKIKHILFIILIGFFVSVLNMLTPYMTQIVYDQYIPATQFLNVYIFCLSIIGVMIGSLFFSICNGFLSFGILSKVKYSLQSAFFDRLFKLKQTFINKYENVDLSLRVMGVAGAFTSIGTDVVSALVGFIFSFVFFIQMNLFMPSLSIIGLFLTLFSSVILVFLIQRQVKIRYRLIEINANKSTLLFQLIRGITKLRVAGAEERGLKRYIDYHIDSSKENYRIGMSSNTIMALSSLFSIITTIIFYCIIYINGLTDTPGNVVAFFSAYGTFSAAIFQIPNVYMSINIIQPVMKRLKPILEEDTESNDGCERVYNLKGKIEVNNLTFSYDDESPNVLEDVSFSINPGEYVGIAGLSGSGKSTLLKLMLGFAKSKKGKIYYDEHDLDSLNKPNLRKKFGVVLQDGDLISGSIIDNIKIANPKATLDDVNKVLEQVELLEDVEKMPMGIHTYLTEGSGLISGGQKQRILIARALINNPSIIFLDEATSALDNITQAHVCKNLDKIGVTRVVIAHRLSTIINCDRILVLDNGHIAEEGDFETLKQKGGLFSDLVKRQLI